MKLAVRTEESSIPGGGFHYMLHPIQIRDELEAAVFEQIGHEIIEVPDDHGARLLDAARAALQHQLEVAALTERSRSEKRATSKTYSP